MTGDEIVGLISAIAVAFSKDKTIEELQLYVIIFRQLSDTIDSITEHRAVLQGLTQNIVDDSFLDTFIEP